MATLIAWLSETLLSGLIDMTTGKPPYTRRYIILSTLLTGSLFFILTLGVAFFDDIPITKALLCGLFVISACISCGTLSLFFLEKWIAQAKNTPASPDADTASHAQYEQSRTDDASSSQQSSR